jgi:RNA polymerase sigma-70 factor (ECF subfamily)
MTEHPPPDGAGAQPAAGVAFHAVNGPRERSGTLAGSLDDEELVRLAQHGRREAFEELVRRHADRLYAVVLRYCGDATDAEEVVQETFLRAWRGIGGFKRRAQFFTWLYRIGLNEAKRRGSRRPPAEPVSVEESALDTVADMRQAPERQAEQHDVRAALEQAVRALPPGYRAPLILRDVEGLSIQHAAEILGLREAAFKSRLHRARLAVRRALDDYYAEAER